MKRVLFAAMLLAACQRDGRYLGNTIPPGGQRLVYVNENEPATLDPALADMTTDGNIISCIFEGLAIDNPLTSQPMAGMATHYDVSGDGKEFTFYLRGHRNPRGTRLPDIASLPQEFSHGVRAPADSAPAHWSDGSPVKASDFVYSWRRLVDPRTASTGASDASVILNARAITSGKRSLDQLGVEALDDFTLRVRLEAPTPYFVALVTENSFAPVPRQAVERAKLSGRPDSWTRQGNVIGNGPFVWAEWRPYDYLKVKKNHSYYESDLVKLDEVSFLPVRPGPAVISLYRAGSIHSLFTNALPVSLLPALQAMKDFRKDPMFALGYLSIDLHDPPLNNRMLRWAVNMAIDKRAISDVWFGEVARQVSPAMPDYTPPKSLTVEIKGKKYDIMAFDPAGARELLAEAGYPGGIRGGKRLSFPINTPPGLDTAEIIRQQLQANLNIEPRVNLMEEVAEVSAQRGGTLRGLTVFSWTMGYADPYALLGPAFMADYLHWHDDGYYAELDAANAAQDPKARMQKLARCETRLMESMPLIPLSIYPSIYLIKPYVRGLKVDQLGATSFRYAWIDHDIKQGDRP